MKRFAFLVLVVFISVHAFGQKHRTHSDPKQDWITAFKNTVFIGCLRAANDDALRNDYSPTLNYDLLQSRVSIAHADSLGRAWFQTIEPSAIKDLKDNKMVINSILDYYTSKTLDVIAKKEYTAFIKESKESQ